MRYFLPVILLFFHFHVYAQTEKMDSDRPDQTDGTHVIKPGEIQIETDVYYNTFKDTTDAVISSSLIRLGLLDFCELRIVIEEGKMRDHFIDETTQGVFPLGAGTKIAILKNHWWIPDISLIGLIQIPVISKSSEMKMKWAPALIMAVEQQIKKLYIDGNVGLKHASFKNDYSIQSAITFRYEITKKWFVFTEYFGQYAKEIIPQHNIDGGLAYFPRKNLQFNISVGSTVLYEQYNRFILAGTSIRLPK